jgi:hypothetical protein
MKHLGVSGLLSGLRDINDEKISLERVLNGGDDNPYFALFVMGLLSLIPTPAPIPVISNFFGILCCLVVFQILAGRRNAAIPRFLGNISLRKEVLDKVILKINPFFSKIEGVTRERLGFLLRGAMLYIVNIFLLITSLGMVAPIPLLSAVPSTAMIVATFGLLNNDGFLVIVGLVIGVLSVPMITKTLSYGLKFFLKLF